MPSVTRKNLSTRSKRRETIVARVLEAVEALLEETGTTYTELSVERLVSEAGMSRSTFYVYFEDKGDLLVALTGDVIQQLLTAGQVWWDQPATATRDDVRDALDGIMELYTRHRVVLMAVIEVSSYDEAVRETFADMMQENVQGMAAHIRRGQKEGFVHPDLDARRTAAWLVWMAERGFYQLIDPATPRSRQALVVALNEIIWNVLYEGLR